MKATEAPATLKVLLSFSIAHKPLVEQFRTQATDRRCGPAFLAYSIKEPVAGAWKVHAERLIRQSNATICLVGEGTWRSDPVDWEIGKSAALGKRILAVYLESNAVRTPPALREIGIVPMPWDVGTIMRRLYDEN